MHQLNAYRHGEVNLAMITAQMLLNIPKCHMVPTIEKIQEKYAGVVLNVVETFYAVSSWGKQAKTVERAKRRHLLGIMNVNHIDYCFFLNEMLNC